MEDHEAHTKGGQVIKYEKCLIATGGTPFNKFPGDFEFGKDVTTFRDVRGYNVSLPEVVSSHSFSTDQRLSRTGRLDPRRREEHCHRRRRVPRERARVGTLRPT